MSVILDLPSGRRIAALEQNGLLITPRRDCAGVDLLAAEPEAVRLPIPGESTVSDHMVVVLAGTERHSTRLR